MEREVPIGIHIDGLVVQLNLRVHAITDNIQHVVGLLDDGVPVRIARPLR